MKKTFLFFVLTVGIALAACNNESKTNTETTPATTEEPAAATEALVDSPITEEAEPGGDNGTSSMPANVFENSTGKPLAGATVQAKSGTTVVQTVTTDAQGTYQFTQLVTGTSYTFRTTKQGYSPQTKTASFSGTNSLPWFAMQ